MDKPEHMDGSKTEQMKRVLRPTTERSTNRPMDISLACLFAIPALIVLSVLYVLHKLFNRTSASFIYTGERLGKDMKIFQMYKIRTLAPGTEDRLGSKVLNPSDRAELPMGKFLRSTRLDEIPQLLNVVKGDMALVGPRPVRPAVRREISKTIPRYNLRFLVRPGLIGYTQSIMPHSAPKRMRSMVNNLYILNRKNVLIDLFIIARTSVCLPRIFVGEVSGILARRLRLLASFRAKERRSAHRIKPKDVVFVPSSVPDTVTLDSQDLLIDMNHRAICVASDQDLREGQALSIVLAARNVKAGKTKHAKCDAHVQRKTESEPHIGKKWTYVFLYKPISPLHQYMISKYFLKESIFRD